MAIKIVLFAALFALALLSCISAEVNQSDIVILSARTIPENLQTNQSFQIEYAISNKGSEDFNEPFTIIFDFGNQSGMYLVDTGIGSGQTITGLYDWPSKFNKAGPYTLTLSLDFRKAISGTPETSAREPSPTEVKPPTNGPGDSITKVIVITEYESGEITTEVYQGGTKTESGSPNVLLAVLAASACVIVFGFYFIKVRSSSTGAELDKLRKEKEEIEKVLELAKINYYKRKLDEDSYKQITVENQQRLMQIEARMSNVEKRVGKIEKKLE